MAFVLGVATAYSFTLASFVDDLRLDTPLAYLPLLPLCALSMGWLIVQRADRSFGGNSGRELDLWLAIPLLLVALLLITAVPVFWSTLYWIDRLDVVSLALFVTGGVTVLYGVGWTWRLRAPLLLLFLMWPAIYVHAVPQLLQTATVGTNSVLGFLAGALPLGVTKTADPSLLLVRAGGRVPLLVSVGSACSGANAVLGFTLVGGVVSTTLAGRVAQKLAWLIAGAGLAFVANLVRLVSILLLAGAGHPTFALGGYHEVIGLVLFMVVVAVALAGIPLFHLRARLDRVERPSLPARDARTPVTGRHGWRRSAGILLFAAIGVLTLFADRTLSVYSAWMTSDGLPRAQPFGTEQTPAGWQIHHLANYPWGVQYFGAGSSFDRFAIIADRQTTVADVVRTPDSAALSAYNLEACFQYHSYQIRSLQRIDVGQGVTALLLDYYDPASGQRWASLSWIWPVRYRGELSYERVALSSDLLRGVAAPPTAVPPSGPSALLLSFAQQLIGAPAGHDRSFQSVNARMQGLAALLVRATERAQS